MMFFRVTDVSRSFRVYIYYWDVFTSIFPVYYCRSRVSHTTVPPGPLIVSLRWHNRCLSRVLFLLRLLDYLTRLC